MLRTTPIPPRTPTCTPNLESPAPPSRPTGGLTFHLSYIHNTARNGTSHRVSSSSQLCAEWRHTLAQTDLAAPVLGLLMTEGHLCFRSVDFLLCFLFSPHFFKRRDFSVMNSGPVLYLIYLIFCKRKKKVFIVVQIYLHFVVLGKGCGYCLSWRVSNKMGWSGEETYLSFCVIFPHVAHFDSERSSLRSSLINLNFPSR